MGNSMNKILWILILIISYLSTYAQDSKLEISPMAGYSFNGSNNWGYSKIDMKDAASVSIAAAVRFHEDALIEVSYTSMNTDVETVLYGSILGNEYYKTPVNAQYYHLSLIREFSSEKVRPFTIAGLGVTNFHPTSKTEILSQPTSGTSSVLNSDIWTLSLGLGGGAKIAISNRIGLRLQGRMLLPMYFDGVGIYCGSGCGGGATFGVYFLQLDLSGGIIINLGEY